MQVILSRTEDLAQIIWRDPSMTFVTPNGSSCRHDTPPCPSCGKRFRHLPASSQATRWAAFYCTDGCLSNSFFANPISGFACGLRCGSLVDKCSTQTRMTNERGVCSFHKEG